MVFDNKKSCRDEKETERKRLIQLFYDKWNRILVRTLQSLAQSNEKKKPTLFHFRLTPALFRRGRVEFTRAVFIHIPTRMITQLNVSKQVKNIQLCQTVTTRLDVINTLQPVTLQSNKPCELFRQGPEQEPAALDRRPDFSGSVQPGGVEASEEQHQQAHRWSVFWSGTHENPVSPLCYLIYLIGLKTVLTGITTTIHS